MSDQQPPHTRALDHDENEVPTDETMWKDFADMVKRGRKLYNLLKTSPRETSKYERLDMLYKLDTTDLVFEESGLEWLREDNESLPLWFVDVLNLKAGRHDDSIYSNGFNVSQGLWVVSELNKTRDKAPEEKRLYASEASYQSWELVAKRKGVENPALKKIALWSVINVMTKEAIWAGRGGSPEEKFYPVPEVDKEYGEGDAAYYALLGSPVGGCVTRALVDHGGG
ncbi:hypothetical protein FQN54_000095 [Arachnomyces sp. PD_36]|nr:hypothetical protein FQN54_000095 [Arachnomyces sp. PD_36]